MKYTKNIKYKIVEESEGVFCIWFKLPWKPWLAFDIKYSSAYNAESFGLVTLRKHLQYPRVVCRGECEI